MLPTAKHTPLHLETSRRPFSMSDGMEWMNGRMGAQVWTRMGSTHVYQMPFQCLSSELGSVQAFSPAVPEFFYSERDLGTLLLGCQSCHALTVKQSLP